MIIRYARTEPILGPDESPSDPAFPHLDSSEHFGPSLASAAVGDRYIQDHRRRGAIWALRRAADTLPGVQESNPKCWHPGRSCCCTECIHQRRYAAHLYEQARALEWP